MLFLAACTSLRPTASTADTTGERIDTAAWHVAPPPEEFPTERQASYYYLEGIRAQVIDNDPEGATEYFLQALRHDSLHAPSCFELAGLLLPTDPKQALAYSRKAVQLDPENSWYQQQLGRLYILNEDYASAREVYLRILRQNPNSPENYRYLAALYDETGSPYTALAVLDSAEVRFGYIEELSGYRRQLLINTGMIDRAIAEGQEMTVNSPYDSRNFVILGDLYAETGKDSLAMEAFQQALSIDPDDVGALTSLADFYRLRGNMEGFLSATKQLFSSDMLPLEEKLSFFNEVIKNPTFYQQHYFAVNDLVNTLAFKYPTRLEVINLYAEHQINSGQIEEALQTYKNALLSHDDIELYQTVIDIEAHLQQSDSVSYYADQALARYPGNMELYLTKSVAQYHTGQYDEAIRTLDDALPFAPSDSVKSTLYSSMGQIAHQRDSLSAAAASYYRQALKYDPENLSAIYNYSESLIRTGKNPEKALTRLRNDSLRSVMLGTIGDLVYQRDSLAGRHDAFSYYEKALRYDPDNIMVLNNYSYFLSLENRELEKALAMIARVMELEPGNPTYIDTYGWILYQLGRYSEARVALRQAVALDRDNNKELLIHYGDILYKLNEYFMASVYWKKAEEAGYDADEIESRLKLVEGK
jgi:tetratricopeptide (TPR) repeat protein